jgi:hydrogenase nickel incorporation protein HypA/HybF
MHELSITQNIVAIVAEHAQGKKVQRVLLEIGKLSAILPDAIKFCFDICSQGTVLEGAMLQIKEMYVWLYRVRFDSW